MALAWTLRDPRVTSAVVGASSVAQLEDNVAALEKLAFSDDELAEIDRYATDWGSTSGRSPARCELVRLARYAELHNAFLRIIRYA